MGRFGRFRSGRNRGNIQQRWTRQIPQAIESPPFVVGTYTPYIADDVLEQQRQGSQAFESEHAPIAPIFTEDIVSPAQASTVFPLMIDLKDFVIGTDPSKTNLDFNVLEVEEVSISVAATPWAEDNQFVTVDDNIISWTPRRNYLRSLLRIKYEVSDPLHAATENAILKGNVYAGDMPTPTPDQPVNILPIGGGVAPPTEGEIELALYDDDVIGDPEKIGQFAQQQGINPTCALASVAAILIQAGVTDRNGNPLTYNQLLNDASTVITLDGETLYTVTASDIIRVEPSRPRVPQSVIESGELPEGFFDIVRDGDRTGVMSTQQFLDDAIARGAGYLTSEIAQYLQDLIDYRNSPMYDGYLEEQVTEVEIGPGGTWAGMIAMMEYYGAEPRIGQGREFSTVILELLNDNALVVGVDADEVYNSDTTRQLQEITDRLSLLNRPQALETRDNHALILSGIDTEPEVPEVFTVDSNPGRDNATYPVDQFIAGFEDSDFYYITLGDPPPETAETRRLEVEVSSHIQTAFESNGFTPEEASRWARKEFVNAIQDENFLNSVERESPGARDSVIAYLEAVDAQRELVKELFPNLDLDEIQSVIEELDIEDTADVPDN